MYKRFPELVKRINPKQLKVGTSSRLPLTSVTHLQSAEHIGPVGFANVTKIFSQAGGRCANQWKRRCCLRNPSNLSAQCRRCPVGVRGRYLPVSKHTLQDSAGQKSWASASLTDGSSDESQPGPQSICASPPRTGPTLLKQQRRQFGSGEDSCFPHVLVGKSIESKWFSVFRRGLRVHEGQAGGHLDSVSATWDPDGMSECESCRDVFILCVCVCVVGQNRPELKRWT